MMDLPSILSLRTGIDTPCLWSSIRIRRRTRTRRTRKALRREKDSRDDDDDDDDDDISKKGRSNEMANDITQTCFKLDGKLSLAVDCWYFL